MSYIYKGLIVSSQPPFDPGYEGMIVVMIHNLSNIPQLFKRGERFVTIEFQRMKHPCSVSKKTPKNVNNFNEPLTTRVVTSMQSLQKGLSSLKKQVRNLYLQIGSLIVILLAIPSILLLFSYHSLSDKLERQQKAISQLVHTQKIDRNKLVKLKDKQLGSSQLYE